MAINKLPVKYKIACMASLSYEDFDRLKSTLTRLHTNMSTITAGEDFSRIEWILMVPTTPGAMSHAAEHWISLGGTVETFPLTKEPGSLLHERELIAIRNFDMLKQASLALVFHRPSNEKQLEVDNFVRMAHNNGNAIYTITIGHKE